MGCCYAGSHFPEAEDRSELVIDIVEVPLFQSWKKLTVVSGPEPADSELILKKRIDRIQRAARIVARKIEIAAERINRKFFGIAFLQLERIRFFPDLRELGENCYLVLDILARIKYNTRCVPKTAGGVSRKSCRGRQTCFAIRPCVFAHRDGSFF